MTGLVTRPVLLSAALLAAVAGLGATVSSATRFGSARARLERRQADRQALQALQEDAVRVRDAVAGYRRTVGRRAIPVVTLLRTVFRDAQAEVQELDPPPVLPGWTVRRTAVKLANVPLDLVGRFVQFAEQQNPPWHVSQCTVRASTEPGRAAEVEFVLQTVERAE
jgi:hypothetical protein